MSAEACNIIDRFKGVLGNVADAEDFVLDKGESIPAQIVIDNPNISLYCLDDVNKRALFVETPPEVDLSQAAFLYMTQFEQAQRVISLSYESLHQVASDLEAGGRNLILVYNIGRCGSTVISHALNQGDSLVSLAEPDIYTQIATARYLDSSRDAEYTLLLDSCTRVLRKHAPTFAVKFRNTGIHICDLLYQAFPEAKNLFLYRQVETWAQSVYSTIIPTLEAGPPSPRAIAWSSSMQPLAPAYSASHPRELSMWESFSLIWLSALEAYLRFREQGIPIAAVRYEDIKAQPKETLAAVFDYCGLPLASLDSAYGAFSKDSQEGTILSRLNRDQHKVEPISEAQYDEMRAIIREFPHIQTSDVILPDTLRPAVN